MLLFCILGAALLIGPSYGTAAPAGLSTLVGQADAIVAVEIVSTDYTATAADGPMYAEARILKAIKGKARAGSQIHFGASAWVGPTFRAGERRIVFLEAVPASHGYYRKARWASLEAGKIDLFVAKEALDRCTPQALANFLKEQEATAPPRKAEFR